MTRVRGTEYRSDGNGLGLESVSRTNDMEPVESAFARDWLVVTTAISSPPECSAYSLLQV
jgi:hypothetical protein